MLYKNLFTISTLISGFQYANNQHWKKVASKIIGGVQGLTPSTILLASLISNIDYLFTGNQEIDAQKLGICYKLVKNWLNACMHM